MAEGRKTGGRTRGTPNKATADVVARLAELGCDPIEGMALIALDPTNPPELRGKMYAELASYVAPKRKAIEHLAEPGTVMAPVVVTFVRADKPDDVGLQLPSHEPVRWSSRP